MPLRAGAAYSVRLRFVNGVLPGESAVPESSFSSFEGTDDPGLLLPERVNLLSGDLN